MPITVATASLCSSTFHCSPATPVDTAFNAIEPPCFSTDSAVKLVPPFHLLQLVKLSPVPASKSPFNSKFYAFIAHVVHITVTNKKSSFLIMI